MAKASAQTTLPFLALLSLCVLAARRLNRFSGRGFRRPYGSHMGYPDNLCPTYPAC
jgi:hypothetical protein